MMLPPCPGDLFKTVVALQFPLVALVVGLRGKVASLGVLVEIDGAAVFGNSNILDCFWGQSLWSVPSTAIAYCTVDS